MDRVRIGVIGSGGIAGRHVGNLAQFEDVALVAFADPVLERAQGQADAHGAKAYADHRAMLDAGGLDALYICTPPFAHGPLELDATEANLPFFVEKPLATDVPTAERIADAVAARDLVTAVGYHWRYLDTVEEAAQRLAEKPAQLISGYWLDSTPPPAWWARQEQSGGQVVEQTTHIVDLARHLVGDVVAVSAFGGQLARPDYPDLDIFTASSASLRFATGAVGSINSSCVLRWPHRIGLHLFSDGQAIELSEHEIMVDTGQGRPVRHAEGDPFVREDRDFIDAVKGQANRIRSPYAEALKTHRLTQAIEQSARSGRTIELAHA